MNDSSRPALVVLSTLFPSAQEPLAGVFIRERMFRVGRELPITVVSPQPWFPLQGILRLWRPGCRIRKPGFETIDGVEIHRPRFFALPVVGRHLDGFFMALGAWPCVRRLQAQRRASIIDAHFAFPDGYAASLLARWCRLPFAVTLRGTEPRHVGDRRLRSRIRAALMRADRVFSVSASLRDVALNLGVDLARTRVIGNGVDLSNFRPIARGVAREALGLPDGAKVLVSVGALVERKGFHRVIEQMPALLRSVPDLHLVVAGGPSQEGDWTAKLEAQVATLGLRRYVRFLGPVAPERLHRVMSAADVFVLATSNEGWANVFLEAMACGLPVVTTRVGGNAEVVCDETLGIVVPFGDGDALREAIDQALRRDWDRRRIRCHAERNAWERRVEQLVDEFRGLAQPRCAAARTRLAQTT